MNPDVTIKKIENVSIRVSTSLKRMIDTGPVPGAALTVVTDKGPLLSEGVGVTDLSQSEEVDTSTIFNIASSSKIFTSIAFMLAVQDGLVSLDDPLVEHWPSFSVKSLYREDEFRKITFRHLLSHRAGLPREPLIGGIYGNDTCTFEESVESIRDCWIVSPMGERYWYSNIGMDIVAYALQLITGVSYPAWIKKNLGAPLNLTSMCIGSKEALKNPKTALGTIDGVHLLEYEATDDYGSGGVWICSEDMAKVLILLLNEGEYDGTEVLERNLFREITRPHFAEDTGHNYGLGVDLSDVMNPPILSHHGGAYGYASTLYWMPDQRIGVSVQANMGWYPGMKNHPHDLAIGAQDRYCKALSIERSRPLPKELFQQRSSSPESVDYSQLTGMYVGLPNAVVQIVCRDDRLFFAIMGEEHEMTPEGSGFLTPRGAGLRFNYDSPESINPRSVSLVSLVHPQGIVPLKRITEIQAAPEAPLIRSDVIDQIVGLYTATYYGSEPTFVVAWAQNGHLYVRDEMYDPPVFPHPSIPGLFFMPHGETVIHEGRTLWVANCRGEKWDDPVSELQMLIEKDPDHRLLSRNVLTEIAQSLKILGRNDEAKEVQTMKKNIHPLSNFDM
jgi:CubicO group peptidase (beta-lactamase class C family)